MLNMKPSPRPIICFRPIRPSDLETLEKIHGDLFPIRYVNLFDAFACVGPFIHVISQNCSNFFRYESEFFQNVVNGRDIVSWGAIDRNQPSDQSDELVGFVTARIVLAKESEVRPLKSSCICLLHAFE